MNSKIFFLIFVVLFLSLSETFSAEVKCGKEKHCISVPVTSDENIENKTDDVTETEANLFHSDLDEPILPEISGPYELTIPTKSKLVHYHGFLMLVAWFGMIAIGIFSARYVKPVTPNTKVNGLHLWFQIHRKLNMTAVVIIIVGTVLIFVAKDLKWTGPLFGADAKYNLNTGTIHSLVGIIAIFLALLQPIGALARCGPDHPKRSIFNCFHRTVGIGAMIFAVIATYFGIQRFNESFPTFLTVIYFIVGLLIVIALEIFAFTSKKRQNVIAIKGMEFQDQLKNNENAFELSQCSSEEKSINVKVVNICGFVLFAVVSISFVLVTSLLLF